MGINNSLCDRCDQEWTQKYLGMQFCIPHLQEFFQQFTGKKYRVVTDRDEIEKIWDRWEDGTNRN